MPRRKANGLDGPLLGFVVLCGLIVSIFTAIRDSIGFVLPIVLIVGIVVLTILYKVRQKKKRLQYLTEKFGDPVVVDHIYNHRFWQGQTMEQLIESLGSPHGVDKKLLKTMTREVWKYNPRGVNRYGLRITLDNEIVSGWDHKQ